MNTGTAVSVLLVIICGIMMASALALEARNAVLTEQKNNLITLVVLLLFFIEILTALFMVWILARGNG